MDGMRIPRERYPGQAGRQWVEFSLLEFGLDGELYKQLRIMPGFKEPPEIFATICSPEDLIFNVEKSMQGSNDVHVGLGACYQPGPEKQEIFLTIITPLGKFEMNRTYGGPPQNGISFAINTALDFLRRSLPTSTSPRIKYA